MPSASAEGGAASPPERQALLGRLERQAASDGLQPRPAWLEAAANVASATRHGLMVLGPKGQDSPHLIHRRGGAVFDNILGSQQ